MRLNNEGQFINSTTGRETGVYAQQNRAGRWQYRMGAGGKVLASGMTPAAFVKAFWKRDDYTGVA